MINCRRIRDKVSSKRVLEMSWDLAYVAVWTPLNQSSGDNPLLLALSSCISLSLSLSSCISLSFSHNHPHPIYLSSVLSLQSRASAALLSFIHYLCRSLSPLRSLSLSLPLFFYPVPSIPLEFRSANIAREEPSI